MAQLTLEDVAELRDPVKRLARDRFGRSHVRETGQPQALDRQAWAALAEIGVLSVLSPESSGGLELGHWAAAGLWEECGQGLVPGPITWTALAAHERPEAGTGQLLIAGAQAPPAGSPFPLLVAHGAEADLLVVLAEDVRIYESDEFEATPRPSLDPFTEMASVRLDGRGTVIGDAVAVEAWQLSGALLTAAYLVGTARLALDTARQHALDRVQFGRPIAAFQAVKHLLADVAANAALAGIAVQDAAARADAGDPTWGRAAHVAKATAADAACLAAKHCTQIHGGMGYTWEADPHLIWKRVRVWERSFGDAAWHAERLSSESEEHDG